MNIDFLDSPERLALSFEQLYNRFGYKKYKVNKFEEYSFYLENESFLDDSRVITFQGASGSVLALKPDITMSIVKHCLNTSKASHKLYYNESVFRIPQGGAEFREIRQVGIENIADGDEYQIVEILNLAIKSLSLINRDFVLCMSNMVLIREAFRDLSLRPEQAESVSGYMCHKNAHDLNKYLQGEGIDDGGLFEKLINIDGNIELSIKQLYEIYKGTKYECEVEQMERVLSHISKTVNEDRLKIDFSHISNAQYYNGLIFAGYIDGLAKPALSGGRYDKLISKMGLKDRSALGFAVYISEIEKLFSRKEQDVLEVKYDDSADIGELLATANKLFDEGKIFNIKKEGDK